MIPKNVKNTLAFESPSLSLLFWADSADWLLVEGTVSRLVSGLLKTERGISQAALSKAKDIFSVQTSSLLPHEQIEEFHCSFPRFFGLTTNAKMDTEANKAAQGS